MVRRESVCDHDGSRNSVGSPFRNGEVAPFRNDVGAIFAEWQAPRAPGGKQVWNDPGRRLDSVEVTESSVCEELAVDVVNVVEMVVNVVEY